MRFTDPNTPSCQTSICRENGGTAGERQERSRSAKRQLLICSAAELTTWHSTRQIADHPAQALAVRRYHRLFD